MSMESAPTGAEFLRVEDFLQHALGKLGVASPEDLSPRDRAMIVFAFHFDRCEKDQVVHVPEIVSSDDLAQTAEMLLCWRSSEVATLCMKLVGFEDIGNFEPDEIDELLDYA